MQSSVIGLFPGMESAEAAAREMLEAGFEREDISVLARERGAASELVDVDRAEPGGSTAPAGMAAGAVLGGLGGLLVGLGMLAIPGVGPVLAAGPIAAALAGAGVGAVGGALVGALVDLGVPEDDARALAEAVDGGRLLLAVRASDERIHRAVEIMLRRGALDVSERTPGAARPGRTVRVYRSGARRRIA